MFCSNNTKMIPNKDVVGVLRATETPTGDDYKAYGIGGITLYEDGGSEIIVLHYSAMISKYQPEIAERMWDTLRDRSHPALLNLPDIENNIIISPLNNMES